MKKLFTLIVLLNASTLVQAQQEKVLLNTFRDAIYLADIARNYQTISDKSEAEKKIESLLAIYIRKEDRDKNPFLGDIFPKPTPGKNLITGKEIEKIKQLSSTETPYMVEIVTAAEAVKKNVSAIPALNWQTAALNGVSDFMASRFKDEMANYTIRVALKRIKDQPNINKLFERTTTYISQITTNGVFYYSDLNLLRYNAEYDLKELPNGIFDYLKNFDQNSANVLETAKTYYKLINDFKKNDEPVKAINDLTEDYLKDNTSLGLIQIMNNAFRNIEGSSKIWISPSELAKDPLIKKFFLGMLYGQLKSLPIKLLREDKDTSLIKKEVENKVNKYLQLYSEVEEAIRHVSDRGKSSKEEVKDYLISIFNLYKPLIVEKIKSLDTQCKYPLIIEAIPLGLDLKIAIEEKEYKFILPLLSQITQRVNPDIFLKNRATFQAISFLVDLNMAQSSAQVKDLLEATALPIGSASIKRANTWDVSLNGYVGASAGYETLNGIKDGSFNYGLTAPIGVTISHKIAPKSTGSWSFFISLLDLGSLVNQNLANNVTTDTDIKFEQFLSPGIGIFHNFGNTPFTMGLHLTGNPSKREINNQRHIGAFRVNFSLLVDIPLFNFK